MFISEEFSISRLHGISSLVKMSEHIDMDLREESSRYGSLPSTTSRNLSSSSSAFFSANQSPFFSPRSPTCQLTTRSNTPCNGNKHNINVLTSVSVISYVTPIAKAIAALTEHSTAMTKVGLSQLDIALAITIFAPAKP